MNIINGSATGTNGSKINTWIEWEDINQDITANTSQLHMILYAQANTSVSTNYSATYNYGYLSYNGANIQYTSLSGYDFRNKAKIKFAEHTYTIAHNADGTKSVTVKGYWTLNGHSDYIKDGTVSGTVTLNTIPRASSFTCPSTFTLGELGKVKIASASDSFTHKIILTFGNQSYTYSNVVTSNKTVETGVTFPTSWGSEIPATSTGLGSVTVETYSGGTRIGTATKSVTVNIPSSWTASATGLSITEANTSVIPASWGVFVKGKSKLLVSLTGLAASSGSSISSYSYSAGGYTGTGSSLTTGVISNSGTVNATGKATDRRGKSVTKTAQVIVADYSNPAVSNVSVYRCTSGGTASSEGTYCYIKATGTKSILGSPDKNTGTLRYRSRVTGGTWSGYTALTSNAAAIKSGFSADNSYEIEIEQTDYFTSAKVTKTISRAPSAERYINFNSTGSGVGIGGQSQTAGKLEVYYPAEFKSVPTVNGTSILNGVVDTTSTQTISGQKTFSATNTYTKNIRMSATSQGVYLKDSAGNQYGGIYDNGSNLWIGATQGATTHHVGQTYISSGYTGSAGNDSIYISVPNASNNGAAATRTVMHNGNYTTWTVSRSDIFYSSGNTFTPSGRMVLGGFMSDAKKSLYFSVTLPKLMGSLTPSITALKVNARHTDGGYCLSSAYVDGGVDLKASGYTLTITKASPNMVTIYVATTTAMNGTTNTPVSISIEAMTLSFT